jgi:hypothetical protein
MPDVLLRLINGVPWGILTDAAIPRTERFTRRDKADDLMYLTTKNQDEVHVHEEHEQLIMRSEIF